MINDYLKKLTSAGGWQALAADVNICLHNLHAGAVFVII